MNPATGLDHIFLLAPPWGEIEHRPHHLMKAIVKATRCKVLYVEDTGKEAFSSLFRPWALFRKIEPGLFAMKRFKLIPHESRVKTAAMMNRKALAFAVRVISRIIGLRNMVQWHWTAYTHDYVGLTGEDLVVYDGACETSLYEGALPQVRSNERDLLRKADLAFAATETLRKMSLEDNSHVFVLANAVDASRLGSDQASAKTVPSDMAAIPHPMLGFIGNIHEWIDGSLIRDIAAMRPSWNIVLIGPVRNPACTEEEVRKFRGLRNVHLLGPRAYQVLAGYLALFDICIIPYRLTSLTKTAETLKFYEYLATGKPIVSTRLPMLEKWSEVVSLAGTPEEFVRAVEKALNESKEMKDRRLELAHSNTWDDRAASAIRFLEDAWARKHSISSEEDFSRS